MTPGPGGDLRERVRACVARTGCITPGEPVVAMVSGGADSTFLMHALAAVHDGAVSVLTCDHGLRPEAAGECARVEAAADALGLACTTVRLGLAPGPGVQERAREARGAAARAHAEAMGATAVATGHTADDQAETVLMRLARGAGSGGASGMAPRRGEMARPLLDLRRAETVALCAALGLEAVDDPTNRDGRFRRARVRHELLPLLDDIAQRDVVEVLVRQADLFASVDGVLRALAAEV
ncbi:MAG: tRNA lysidine(34) synthetase TilS, partial [Thermoleophilia bacterium]|nr:tRNA lysidine(34) synthetase TilS [Thermoleophilia bacterium]